MGRPSSDPNPIALYLDLMKLTLMNLIYDDDKDMLMAAHDWDAETGKLRLADGVDFEPGAKLRGEIWPSKAHTMIGLARLNNLQTCVEAVLSKEIPGDFIETGVWRGGATIFMRAILKVHGAKDRLVWVADSFEGLPKPDAEHYPQDESFDFSPYQELAVSLEEVKANFRRYNLLDDQVRFLPGWFRDTLPQAPIERLAVLRLDGDLYQSTMEALTHLYPKLSVGGYVIVDDYYAVPACRQATDGYRKADGIVDRIIPIDRNSAYWQRTE
jgi:hypothetical protein